MNQSLAGTAMADFQDDAEIIRYCQQGDQRAYAALVDRYQDRAFWVAFNMLGNQEDARDVVQEAFVRVFRAIHRFDFNMSFYTWLYRIVSNLSIDQLRKLKRRRPVRLDDLGELAGELSGSETPSAGIEEDEMKREVRAVLDELPPHYKIVLVLRDLEGLSCKEIAAVTGASHPTVRWRLHTARKLFKEKWERYQSRSSRRAAEGLESDRMQRNK
jgi:RNA polymerase sigma-70 factor (ECF subfamily)